MSGNTTALRRAKIEPERWRQLKEIVGDALEQPAGAARAALIERRCSRDQDLLGEVISLVREAERPGPNLTASLEECAMQTNAILWQDEPTRIQSRIGAYAVIRELGRGGMGTVYLAERADGQFEKDVAIKVLKRGTDTEEVLQRFASERHILARLDHPNIARLLDAGTTDDGLPYFVMEYVAGSPVTEVVREQHLSIAERLTIFLKICAAVEVAHQSDVIHRDLKPSNILVKADREPKLLDFGIAKFLQADQNSLDPTATGQQRLTPFSASPEQARGDAVTAASDVYALGALLYEMLAECKPYIFNDARPSRQEVLDAVCEREPARPSAVAPSGLRAEVAGTLEDIVLFAMRKEPTARYASVAEFAQDIRAYLAGRAIQARPETSKHRLSRWTAGQRRFAPRYLAIALFLLLSGLIAFVSLRPARRGGLAENARTVPISIPEKSIAVLPFRNLKTEPDDTFFADGIHDAILSDLAKIADLKVISNNSVTQYPVNQPRNLREISGQLAVAHVLEGSIQKIGNRVRVMARLVDARSGAQEWAETYQREISDIFALQSDLAQAIVAQLEAKILPSEKTNIEQPVTRDLIAYDWFLRARKIIDGHLDAEDVRASLLQAVTFLEEATRRDPTFTLAFCYLARAHDILYGNGLDPSEARLRLAENAFNAAIRLQPNSADAHLAIAEHFFRCYADLSRARTELELARAGLPNSASFYVLSGNVNRRQGRWSEGEQDFTKAVALDPKNPNAVNYLADTQILMRKFPDAVSTYERAAQIGLDSPILRIRIGIIKFAATGEIGELRAALAGAPETLDVGGGETPLRILVALIRRDYEGAARALAESPRVDFQDVDFSFYYPRAWYEALIARAAGDHAKEITALAAARSVLEARMEARPLNRTRSVLAEVYAGLGLKDQAVREAQAAVEAMPSSKDAYEAPLVQQALAQVYLQTGDKDRAFELVQELVKVPGYLSYGYLAADPAWDPLRGDQPFQNLLAALAPASNR